MKTQKFDLKGLTIEELEDFVHELGIENYRAKQITEWLYKHNISNIDEMTNLSKNMRLLLKKVAYISHFSPKEVYISSDGSKKFLFKTHDGYGIESVLIKEKTHWTICISTQIGCPLKCRFCFSGRRGLIRDLSVSEIVNQISTILKDGKFREEKPNIVFMGMGEPLANYENTLKSLKIILSPWGFNFSHRRVTISTVGLIPQMKRLIKEFPLNLAISLNAPSEEIRTFLMPINRKYPIKLLLQEAKKIHLPHRKRITFEYVLIKDINDLPEHAEILAHILKRIPSKINLIPFNEFPGTPFKRPDEKSISNFQAILHKHHFTAPIRRSKGGDITAACGQLGKYLDKRV